MKLATIAAASTAASILFAAGTFRLTPFYADAFNSDLGTIVFRRGGEGRPVEFSVVRDRVRDLRFRRRH